MALHLEAAKFEGRTTDVVVLMVEIYKFRGKGGRKLHERCTVRNNFGANLSVCSLLEWVGHENFLT
jgi:hypothetical protein